MGNSALISYLRDPKLVMKFQSLCGVSVIVPEDERDREYARKFTQPGCYPTVQPKQKAEIKVTNPLLRTRVRRLPSQCTTSTSKSLPVLAVRTIALLDFYFRFAAELGYEPFYITVFPFFIWNVDAHVGRLVVLLWSFSMYVGQALKPLVRWPRPPTPPVIRLEQNPILEQEYGFPSTHATVCTTLPFYTLYLIYERYEVSFAPAFTIAVVWCLSVSLSRIYLGVHSFMDLVGGMLVSFAIFVPSIAFLEQADRFLVNLSYGSLVALLLVVLMLATYPVEDKWTMDRGDTAAILGVGLGVFLGSWVKLPLDDMAEGPFQVQLFSPGTVGMSVLRFLVGISLILPTRLVMKTLCFLILPVTMPTHGVEEVKKRPFVELPYKIITYTSIGFNVAYLAPALFELCGISRDV